MTKLKGLGPDQDARLTNEKWPRYGACKAGGSSILVARGPDFSASVDFLGLHASAARDNPAGIIVDDTRRA
jgi:hypothetical protein